MDAVMTISSRQELREDNDQTSSPLMRSGQGVMDLRSNMYGTDSTSLRESHLREYSHEDEGPPLEGISSCKCELSKKNVMNCIY